ncbi:MAG: hypothetical protein ACP5D7_10725 [Limnospira sp.]
MPAESMGKITTPLTVTNRIDQANVTRGYITPEDVRSLTLENVLVDTGATTLCLPADAIARLGFVAIRFQLSGIRLRFVFERLFYDKKGRKPCAPTIN